MAETRTTRVDFASLGKPTVDADSGFIRCEAACVTPGVYAYQLADGTIRNEFKPPAEVLGDQMLRTLELKPVTNDHPPDLVTADNAKKHVVGAVGKPRVDGQWVIAPLSVFDAGAIAAMKAGKVEISLGFSCDVIAEAGSFGGKSYSHVQKNFTANHCAIVDQARVTGAHVRIDAAGQPVRVADAVMVRDAIPEGASVADPKPVVCPELRAKCDEASLSQRMQAVREAIRSKHPSTPDRPGGWPIEIYETTVVYEFGDKLWRCSYSFSGTTATLADDSVEVMRTYSPVSETAKADAQAKAENGSERNADATSDRSRQRSAPPSTSQGDATAIATPPKEIQRMAKTKINDADVELEANTASLLDAERNRKDAEHKSKLDALTAERDSALKAKTDAEVLAKSKADEAAKFSGELEIAKTKLDTAEKQVAELVSKIDSFAKADLASKVAPVLGDAFKADGKSVREIKCAVIEKVTGKQVSADKADAFVDVVFDGAMEIFETKNPALAAARAATVATESERADAAATDPDKKRAEVAAKAQAAWKTPKGGK